MNYQDIDGADTYFETRLFSEPWTIATTLNKTAALTMATKAIDNLKYDSKKVDPDQANEFPREPNTTVPQAIKDACCEIALTLLDGNDPNEAAENLSVERRSFSGVSTTYNTDIGKPWVSAGILSKVAWNLLVPYMADHKKILVRRGS